MSKYDDAIKLMDECCGNGKEIIIALATISLEPGVEGKPRPANRMLCAYYEDGDFYVSTDAQSNKVLQIEHNNDVTIAGIDGFSFHGIAENLGWVGAEKNRHIRDKFKQTFDWFDSEGDENNPDSIVLLISPTIGSITDFEARYGQRVFEVDFIEQVAK
ncbi:pyridoxamine 5'-phosphate oxidase family protein [Vibrio sp. WXL103]|uniref:pyridoxamine 5'-phosphate oxidase family protein n=1 Tax=unclassified Vibrio TaxID=2614977 RepID=UPI003EC591D7